MENITLEQIIEFVIKLAAIVGAMKVLVIMIIAAIKKLFRPIRIQMLKSDLATFMGLAECGLITTEQRIIAHEDYDEYTKVLKQNSWVHDKFEELVKEGKI